MIAIIAILAAILLPVLGPDPGKNTGNEILNHNWSAPRCLVAGYICPVKALFL
jgi:hypothetical protein